MDRSFIVFMILMLFGQISGGFCDDREKVSTQIEERTGYGLRPSESASKTRKMELPPGISPGKALSEQDAVAVALWNNAALEATLAELGLARSDVIEAGLLVNPDIQTLFGIGVKPFEFLLTMPVQSIWQRPRRVASAKLNLESISESLVQNGIDLVRDVRIAHADLALAEKETEILADAADLRREISILMDKRLQAGDISVLDYHSAQLASLTAEDAAAQAKRRLGLAQHRLQMLMGLRGDPVALSTEDVVTKIEAPGADDVLIEVALSSRPDLRAAEMAIEAAGRRVGWERSRILAYIAPLLSTKDIGTSGIKSGPGIKAEVPVFNRNQGGISRAEAEVNQATLQYLALVEQVEFEVRSSRSRLLEAQESLARIQEGLLPAAEKTIHLAEKALENGDISYLDVKQASTPIFDVRLSEERSITAFRQALAELERAIGRRL